MRLPLFIDRQMIFHSLNLVLCGTKGHNKTTGQAAALWLLRSKDSLDSNIPRVINRNGDKSLQYC